MVRKEDAVICKNCTIAGNIAAGNILTSEPNTPDPELPGYVIPADQLTQIRYWHSRCLAPKTCPCQHRITQTS
jgi:hypothetical protein